MAGGTEVRVCHWSHDERRVFVSVRRAGVELYAGWEPVRYDDDGRGWVEGPDGWVCVYA